jgi:hypothetical protein
LSEVFTQDLEDIADYIQADESSTMGIEEAEAIKITFGTKHKGETLGEIYRTDRSYFDWLRKGDRTDPVIRKACEVILYNNEKIIGDRKIPPS